MRIVVEVSPSELEEMCLDVDQLKQSIIYDLESSGDMDYSGYTLDIICVDPSSTKMTLSKVVDQVRLFSDLR